MREKNIILFQLKPHLKIKINSGRGDEVQP